MRRFIPIIILAIAAVALGQSRLFVDPNTSQPVEAPHSPAAIDAKAKHDLSVKIARAAYQKAVVVADQQYIDALAAAEDVALKDGIGAKPEADRIDAARMGEIDEMKGDEGGAEPIQDEKSTWMNGTMWSHNGSSVIVTFLGNGQATASVYHQPATWKKIDANAIFLQEPGRKVNITFSEDRQASVWEYDNGDVAWAKRIKG